VCGSDIGYTVPQYIRPERIDKSVDVFFRVRRNFSTSSLNVTSGGQKLISYPRGHMAPGEMEHITLPKQLLSKAAGGAITISAKEVQK
ncbi:MAG TPA: pyridine nucleotide-disulfide oxidoreductase, partial [Ruminococcaceae bacterium]|nr:pyridine nucleotide-disulfide oxidoreductase [Oscillospiraceae bacterium]